MHGRTVETDEDALAAITRTLRPCPHCGPMPAMPELVRSDVSRLWQVYCGPCGSSSGASRDPAAAAAGWNSRHASGPDIASTSPALTSLALLLGNSIDDLAPSTRPARFGFKDDATRIAAYALARDIVLLLNAERARAAVVEAEIGEI